MHERFFEDWLAGTFGRLVKDDRCRDLSHQERREQHSEYFGTACLKPSQ